MDGLFNLVSVTQAAKALGVARQTIYDMIKQKRLTAIEVAGYVTVPKSQVDTLKRTFKKGAATNGA